MKTFLVFFLILANSAAAATALPDAEKHRLASYLAYVVVGVEAEGPGGESIYTVGANCGECNGSGELGDGTVVFPCEWSDGLYYCNKGKIAKKSDGDSMDYEVDEAMCEAVCDCGNCDGNCGGGCCDNCKCGTPKRDELFDDLSNAPKRADESYVLYLERQLQEALEESGMGKATCPDCPTCADPQPEESQEETQPVEKPSCLVDLSQTTWNWQGTSNVAISTMREHLTDEHSIDPASLDKMSREELIALHNLLHNEEVRASTPQAKSKTKTYSSGGCPGGNCPTSGSSRSRGFFGRWR
ncbi:MAG: hypothetical protein ACR2NI_06350 [Pirellulales bacterium]